MAWQRAQREQRSRPVSSPPTLPGVLEVTQAMPTFEAVAGTSSQLTNDSYGLLGPGGASGVRKLLQQARIINGQGERPGARTALPLVYTARQQHARGQGVLLAHTGWQLDCRPCLHTCLQLPALLPGRLPNH